MKILFIGGVGNISWYCTQKALERGHEVWHLNREVSVKTRRQVQPEVHKLKGDMRNLAEMQNLLTGVSFDVVVDFICFNKEQAENDIALFRNKTKKFVAISSESVYKRRSQYLPFRESTTQYQTGEAESTYINGKVEMEYAFMKAYQEEKFPVVIVRPAYTYDTIIPVSFGHNCYTGIFKFQEGYPLLICGEGNTLWTFTHSEDFANAFVPLIELEDIIGEDFQITSNEWLTWNEQSELLLKTLHLNSQNVFHIPYDEVLAFEGLGDREMNKQRMWNAIYSNDKIKQYVPGWKAKIPFEEGISRTLSWMQEDPVRMRRVERVEKAFNYFYSKYKITV